MKRAVCLILALLFLAGCGGAGSASAGWQEQYDLGIRYLSEQNYSEAILAFTAAIEVDPNRPELYVGRAQAYIASGETAENLAAALADYEQARELDYTDADLWLGLADVHIRQGDLEKAREVLEEGLEATGGDPSIQAKLDELDSGTVTDGAGKLRRNSGYNEDGSLAWYHVHTYDESGRESGVTHYDGEGNELGHVDILYDEAGRKIQDISFVVSNGLLTRIERSYDEAGRVAREVLYPLYDVMPNVHEYAYNDQGQMVRQTIQTLEGQSLGYTLYGWEEGFDQYSWLENYSDTGDLIYRVEYLWDDQGRILQSETFGPDGELMNYMVTEYDGEQSVTTTYDPDGNLVNRVVK